MISREYTAVAYNTVTGRVMADIDFTIDPTWSTTINDPGGWQVTVPLRDPERTAAVRGWCVPWLVSVAILLGDTVCQAGPIVAYQPSDTDGSVQVSGKGLWEALNSRLLFNAVWDPSATRITDSSADLTLTGSLWRIARELVNHATNWQHRLGGNLPIDLPPVLPADNSNTRSWHGWEMSTPGQRLQELTQSDSGPDVLFQPYMTVVSGFRTIRHTMLVGTPYLQDLGVPLNFSYRRSLVSMTINGDGTKQANSAFVKGTGNEAGQMYGYATSAVQVAAGWPALDMVDTNHTSSLDQSTLDGWAMGDLALYGKVPEQWQATVLADADPVWGEYWPGHFANYSLKDHPWIPNGTYRTRILGASGGGSGTQRGTIKHQLQTFRTN